MKKTRDETIWRWHKLINHSLAKTGQITTKEAQRRLVLLRRKMKERADR